MSTKKVKLESFGYHVHRFVGKVRDENGSCKDLVPSSRLNLFLEASGNSDEVHKFHEMVIDLIENYEELKKQWGLDEYAKSKRD